LRILKAPFPWFGGKSRVARQVWDAFGDVPNYVEPFAGSLAVLLGRPSEPRTETVNDKDACISNFWRALQAAPEEVARWADYPVIEADLHARHRWLVAWLDEHRERLHTDPNFFDAQVAGWWVWGICQWIGSGWCANGFTSDRISAEGERYRGGTFSPALISMGVLRPPPNYIQETPTVMGARRVCPPGIWPTWLGADCRSSASTATVTEARRPDRSTARPRR